MIQWGVSAQSHDAALAVYKDNEIVYASHSERYSRLKNDKDLHRDQLAEALEYGEPERVYFYENHWKKKWRQLWAGQYNLLLKDTPTQYLRSLGVSAPVTLTDHHLSHAAYAYYTDPEQDNLDILVIDSIGEWETMTIWTARNGKLQKVFRQGYPHSVGLWYSAMTQRLGLKPQEHEYILMGMAAIGDSRRFYNTIKADFFEKLPDDSSPSVVFKTNLHRGCLNWRPDLNTVRDYADIAATVQFIYNQILQEIVDWMYFNLQGTRVAIVGGCALNCVANTRAYRTYPSVWVPVNPGDAGSSVGAILAHRQHHVRLSPYLGTNIAGDYPYNDVINDLKLNQISAVAAGPAEFGPRALGHRSILADPRPIDIKDRVNAIKHREDFRPFAPMVLAEHAKDIFRMPSHDFEAPYMQYAIECYRPRSFPGIIHLDGSSRIQTVAPGDGPVRTLLEKWYNATGCPMLLNTSLNIKGEPLVNTREDAARWTMLHGLPVRIPK